MPNATPSWLDKVRYNADGLVAAIAQDAKTGRVLMMAWMNQQALHETQQTGRAVYWSRSRQALWRKGEQSGHTQQVHDIRLDCDGDAILLQVTQVGGIACHTGRQSCFYQQLQEKDGSPRWQAVDPVIKDPDEIYS